MTYTCKNIRFVKPMIHNCFGSFCGTIHMRKVFFFVLMSLFVHTAFAQLPADVKNVKVDELSDAQIRQYIVESEKSGIPESQQEALALKNGMPPAELQKLKDRVAKIRATPAAAAPPKVDAAVVNETSVSVPQNIKDIAPPASSNIVNPIAPAPQVAAPVEVNSALNPNEIYGHHLFKNNNLQFFEKATDAKAPDGYIIGPNDELTVSVFGFSYFNEVLKVDPKGAINPTNIGPIMLKGLTFGNAKALIRSKFGQFFDLANNQLTVTLSYSRVITVNFVGEVNRPGSYKIPALNTAFNALIAVGGPNELGSVRAIQIRRNGKTIKVLDVYEYLNNPNSKMDFYLEDNDYIYIAPSAKIVTISGEVKRPMLYELKPQEDLEDLIAFAGGLSASAYTKLIEVSRSGDDGTQQQLFNFSLDSLRAAKKKYPLKDGDRISIGSKSTELRQYLEISGPVYRAGNYQFVKGDRISDLIKRANGLRKEALLEKAYLIRTNPDKTKEYISINLQKIVGMPIDATENKLLQEGDVLRISSTIDFIDAKKVSSSGLFRRPATFEYFEGIRLSDLVFLSGGVREEANKERSFLVRTLPDFTKVFIPVNLTEVMANPEDTAKNKLLQRGDILTVVAVTDYLDKMEVNAVGLFRKPGYYDYVNGMTVSDLLFVAGGVKMEADLLNIEISRISFFADDYKPGEASRVVIKTMQMGKDAKLSQDQLDFKLNPFDQVFVRMVPDFELPKNLTINGEVKYPGTYALARKDEHLDELIKRAGGLNRFAFPEGATLYRPSLPGGYVVMNLKDAVKRPRSRYNYILKEGDVVSIPRVIDFTGIRGDVEYLAVVNQEQVNAPFTQGKRANYYVKEFANGFTKTSFKRKTYVLENNGKVSRTKNFVVFKIYPKVKKGGTVYVVTKPKKDKELKKQSEPVNWTNVIERTTVKITGLITLYLLLQTVTR
ncbi:hypothetical protein AEM51_08020 [Bacteroidetes bacterium UKL13-3]|nr:hypothetical protein AEM51_08020 [Bacteroidetes bacterium UKL13-3]HCP94227.1 hypothetical protein [Bacteroidota bacterium]